MKLNRNEFGQGKLCVRCKELYMLSAYTICKTVCDVCSNKRIAREKQKVRDYQTSNWKRLRLEVLRKRSLIKNIDFDLTEEYIDTLVMPVICPVLGIKIDKPPHLDRIINSKGYVQGNVMYISERANTLKNNGTLEEFQAIVKYMEFNSK